MKNSAICENMDEAWKHFNKKYEQVTYTYYTIFLINSM